MSVACVGECMVEFSERPDGHFARGFGGDTLNTAVYLARLGVAVDYVTALGDDPFSDEMLAAWRAEGVGTRFVLRIPGALPGLYVIQTDGAGERRFSHWRDSAPVRRMFAHLDPAQVAAALAGRQVVYLSGITLSLFPDEGLELLSAALSEARRKGARVAFDTNFRARGWPDRARARQVYRRMLAASDIVFAGLDDLGPLFGTAGPDDAAALLEPVPEAVLKLPDLSCRVAGGAVVVPEPVASVLDTTAAGDSFAAGYLAARLAGAAPPESARAGHRLAGAVVGHRGAIVPRELVVPA